MARGTRTSQEIRDRVVRLYTEEKHGIPVVAEMVGIPSPTVWVILKGAGIATTEKRRREYQVGRKLVRWGSRENKDVIDAAIRQDYAQLGPVPIAARFGLTKGVISKRAWQLGVKCTTGIARKDATVAAMNDNCDHTFFDHWHPNLAWLLGYSWADGAVDDSSGSHKVNYRAAVQDEELILNIHCAIKSKAKIQRFKAVQCTGVNKQYTGQPQVGFSICSINIVKTLINKYGVLPNKSNIDPPMPDVPDDMMSHFARGVIDGDGSICEPHDDGRIKIIIYGSHQFLEKLRHRIAECASVKLANRLQHGTSEKLSSIGWAATDDVTRLLRWLYPPGDYLSLVRKRETAMEYLAGKMPVAA